LLYGATKPFSEKKNKTIHFLLALFSPKPVTDADKKALQRALSFAGASFVTYSP